MYALKWLFCLLQIEVDQVFALNPSLVVQHKPKPTPAPSNRRLTQTPSSVKVLSCTCSYVLYTILSYRVVVVIFQDYSLEQTMSFCLRKSDLPNL